MHPRQAGSDHLLSDLRKCRQCGEPYTYAHSRGEERTKGYVYLVCNTRKHKGPEHCDSPRLPASAFENMTLDIVDEDILSLLHLQIAIEELRQNSGTFHADSKVRLEEAQKRVAEFDRRLERLYLTYENGDIEYEFYAGRYSELREMKAKAQAELERLEGGLDDTSIILNDPEAVLSHSAELKSFLKDEAPVRARAWLKTFLKGFWVEPGHVTYEDNLPLPPGSANTGKRKHQIHLDDDFRSTTRVSPNARGWSNGLMALVGEFETSPERSGMDRFPAPAALRPGNRPRTPGDQAGPVSRNRPKSALRTPGPDPAGHSLGPGRSQYEGQHETQDKRPGHHGHDDQCLGFHPGDRDVQNRLHAQENDGNRQDTPEGKANPVSRRMTLQDNHPQVEDDRLTYQTATRGESQSRTPPQRQTR